MNLIKCINSIILNLELNKELYDIFLMSVIFLFSRSDTFTLSTNKVNLENFTLPVN